MLTKYLPCICLALLLAAISSQCKAVDIWTTEQKALGWTWGALQMVDYMQTIHISNNPDRFIEVGSEKWIGEHPSNSEVTQYFVVSTAFKLTVMHYLPSQWRTRFQYLNIGYTGSTVYHNERLGIGVDLPF